MMNLDMEGTTFLYSMTHTERMGCKTHSFIAFLIALSCNAFLSVCLMCMMQEKRSDRPRCELLGLQCMQIANIAMDVLKVFS